MRLLHARDLQIDESMLTGESIPVQKESGVLKAKTVLADRSNMAYASTLVTYGQGKGVVTAIGNDTEVGQIAKLLSTTEELKTPLTLKIARFSHILLYVILGLAAATFAVGIARGNPATNMFMAAVALAVGAIPEGLPAAITIILAIGVSRMARRRAIIRKLPAVETLGSTTIICSDKTGTLTENQMTVQAVYDYHNIYKVTGVGYGLEGKIFCDDQTIGKSPSFGLVECLRCGLLCNDSLLVEKEGRWEVQGDPTEGALIVAAHKAGLSHEAETERMMRVESIPFESQHQYMATLHSADSNQPHIIYIKGAVETILEKCSSVMDCSGNLNKIDTGRVFCITEEKAAEGYRVLAFAQKVLPQASSELNHQDVASGMTFLGLQCMIDPSRPEAAAAVRKCQKAGITVKMITGDHALTASTIAFEIGLNSNSDSGRNRPAVMTGRELANCTDAELVDAAEITPVFARVTPEQKLRLIQALQDRGHIVAMTGDGVNDAPALKRANIGVAMGITGTEVAKEAADMVLTDDNFASIEAAVEEGRCVFDNLIKFIVWTLPTNAGEGLVIFTAVIFGITLPILPVQILWINMSTALLLGLMLAFEPMEKEVMCRQPRSPGQPILSGILVQRIGLVALVMLLGAFGLFEWELFNGAPIELARTVAVNVFVIIEVFYLFNCRSLSRSVLSVGLFSNLWLLLGVAAMLFLQVMFTYLPFMNKIFHTVPIPLESWGRIVLVGLFASLAVTIEKRLRGRGHQKPASE